MDRRRGRGTMVGLLLVQALSEYSRLDRKPPVTAGLIAANTIIYLRPKFLDPILPALNEVWFNPHLILKHKDVKRFLLSAFYHVGEPHLFYNMLSLLWKGIQLEATMGSAEYASMVASLLAMSQGITLLLTKVLLAFDYERAYYDEYSVGFSGVLFAMKVVLYAQSENYAYIHGLMVPARYAAWAELFLIQAFVPGVSFLGHLGGVLAGILYLHLKRTSRRGANGLFANIIQSVGSVLTWPLKFLNGTIFRGRSFGGGTVGGSRSNGQWRCQACTFDNNGLLSVCEICGTERGENGFSGDSPDVDASQTMSLEELRQRRVQRFGR